ncbi:unnamed protein product [Caenorhabditis bovis]|uniref:Uncharacterized protein n=1 Tax=Caenorhabditis bovis TaxID=2654633 RepID=A0A8S1EJI9_9PELO|nr:unnamed protein product [Caenorhabditis bovis]
MVVRQKSETQCFNPRDYQVELLEKACKRNVIVQLGTGSGKTFIAVLLLKEFGVQLYAPLDNGGKRAFFIVEKVNLVEQQAEHIERHTKFNVGRIHGQLKSDVWNSKKDCDDFIAEHHVIVITAQCLLDLILHAFIKIQISCVMIFDECHHALGSKHPYRLIMSEYKNLKKRENVPRILGLTASLIKEKTAPSKLEEKLIKLETIMDCSIETASDLVALSKFGAKPYEAVVYCHDYNPNSYDFSARIFSILENVKNFVNSTIEFNPDLDLDPRRPIRDSLKTTVAVFQQLGPWAAWKMAQSWIIELSKLMKTQMLPDKASSFLNLARTTMITIRQILDPIMKPIRKYEDVLPYIPHRVIRLFELLQVYSPEFQKNRMKMEKPDTLCGIVFVDQRCIAFMLHIMIRQIRKWDSQFRFIQQDYVVGASGNNITSTENLSLHKRQGEVLRKFQRSDLNVLIATSVLEEGVDVKQCNVVVKFDRPLDVRSFVQSRGRARRVGAKYVIFVEEKEVDACSNDLNDFKMIEKLLLDRSRNVHNPLDDCEVVDMDAVDSIVEPYVVESTGATVKMSNAIQLVNRYCGKLPSDIFTRLVPHNRIIPVVENGETMYCAELLLPINSPIKKAIKLQDPMKSKKLAQMAVALEACRQLHQKGELDDNLLPKGRESIAKLLEHFDDEPDEYAPGLHAKVGSSKRKQLYDKKVARVLNESIVEPDEEVYVYVMDLERMREPEIYANPKRRKFTDPHQYEYCFGFLSSQKLPKVPPFPLYLRQGDMRVRLMLANKVKITKGQLEEIKQFHDYLFTQVLQLVKGNMLMFNMSPNTPINTLVVPLNKQMSNNGDDSFYSINMDHVSQVVANMEKMPRVPDEETRKNFQFNADNYKDAIVMPWYRNIEQPAFFYVAEILYDMNPASPFPDENFSNFNEYFIKKYNLIIYDQSQPLLDVDYSSSRLSLLLPRVQARKRIISSSSTDSVPPSPEPSPSPSPSPSIKSRNTQRQILVPELMDIHPISATLWNLITALPSIFYRLNQMFLTDELRQIIITNAFGKSKEDAQVPDNLEWPPLTYPATFEEKQSVMVRKIQQLKDLNKTKNNEKEKKETNDNEFVVGVWDPEDAIRCGVNVTLDRDIIKNEDDDMAGLMNGLHDGNISDEDEDDLGPFVMHDYKQKLTSQLHGLSGNGLWTTNNEIVESGWGELDDVDPADTPFEIIGGPGTNGLDLRSLMEDIGRHVAPPTIKQEPPADITPSTNEVPAAAKPEPEKRPAVASTSIKEARDILECMGLLDQRDVPKRTEEVVDLEEFDDEDDQEIDKEASELRLTRSTSDDEFEEIQRGEMIKEANDMKALQYEKDRGNEPMILNDKKNVMNFSFAKESPALAPLRTEVEYKKCADISHSDNEVGYGVSPCLLLTALTTSNASDGISLERFETIGDSFLKFAVTDYLYHCHTEQHEGKLSFARSKEVSNCNLYRLGKRLGIPQLIVGSKFDAFDSWLPPCYVPTFDFKAPNTQDAEEKDNEIEMILEGKSIEEKKETQTGWDEGQNEIRKTENGIETINFPKQQGTINEEISPLPYNLLTQQNISDKSIADAMEALIGVHLLTLGPHPTLKVMKWMGLKVLLADENIAEEAPLLRFIDSPMDPDASIRALDNIWQQFQFGQLEKRIGYQFKDRAYLVQAFTHASYFHNRITGCYQRLEFLGDAVLDYMITRYLFEDVRQYSPGVLTDLRSALVNNTIFASLAVKYEFQKHFVAMCPGLHHMIEKFVKLCSERNFDTNFNAEMYMVTTEEEIDEGSEEDIEVPKAMGDIFESLAGAIYLDSGRNLDTVWAVVYGLMKGTIEECCANPPRSPIRELMELESSKARFSKMERIIESGKVRVTVDIGNSMRFTGMGRNYRIAKTTAAKRALKYIHMIEKQRSEKIKSAV